MTLSQCPEKLLNQAKPAKEACFGGFICDRGPGNRFVALPISTIGGWNPDAHKFASLLPIVLRTGVPEEEERGQFFIDMRRDWFKTISVAFLKALALRYKSTKGPLNSLEMMVRMDDPGTW